jgi:CRP/FNR family transcriptional regulator, cyclic AMP receptor protein
MIEIIEGAAVGDCPLACRFLGPDGRRRLVDMFRQSAMTSGEVAVAEALAEMCDICIVDEGRCLILQDGPETEMFLILVGEVDIERNGRPIASRRAGLHVGELALIDSKVRRSATVRAKGGRVVVARLREPAFAALAETHSMLWRNLAVEISSRHRERISAIPLRNEKPRIFIGSSREALTVAKELETGLKNDSCEVKLWTKGVFGAGQTTIESLEIAVKQSDFALLVLSNDDVAEIRGQKHLVARDNVIFELGLFMGALGRSRAFALKPYGLSARRPWWSFWSRSRPENVKIPTDLLGVSTLDYGPDPSKDRLSGICTELQETFLRLGPK